MRKPTFIICARYAERTVYLAADCPVTDEYPDGRYEDTDKPRFAAVFDSYGVALSGGYSDAMREWVLRHQANGASVSEKQR